MIGALIGASILSSSSAGEPEQVAPPDAEQRAVASEPLEITVRDRRRLPDPFDSSRAASRVEATQIREATPGALADALRGRAGTSVQQTSPGQGTIFVRGLSGREVMHLIDGVPLNAAIFRAGNNQYLGLVDPYALDGIDVVRGASSVIHGSDALGGVVSMTTALPGYSLAGDVTNAFAFQALTLNPLGSVSRASVEQRSAVWTAMIGATFYRFGDVYPGGGVASPTAESYRFAERPVGGSYRPAHASAQIGTAYEMVAANSAFRRKLAERTEIVVRGQVAFQPELVRYDEITPRFKREFPASAESALRPLYRAMASVTLNHRPMGSWIDSAVVALSWQRLGESIERRKYIEQCLEDGVVVDVDADACGDALRLTPGDTLTRETNRSDAIALRAEVRKANAARRTGLRVGADAVHDVVTSEAFVVGADQRAEPERYPTGSTMTQLGLFAQVEAEPLHDVRVHAGGRGAFFLLDIRERAVNDEAQSAPFRRALVDGALAAGARYEFAPGVSVVANAGRGVRSPNVQDFSSLGARAKDRFQLPNPDIRPEYTVSVDTGLKAKRGRFSAEAYVFYLRLDDAIVLAPTTKDGASATADGDAYEWSVNASHIEYFGVEAMLDVPLDRSFGVEGHLLAMRGTQHNDPALGLPLETPADRVPPVSARVGAWFEPTRTVRIEAFASGRVDQTRLNDPTNLEDNRIPEGGTPGFLTWHARGSWQFRRGATARLALDNLTNELVLEHGSGFYRPGFSATTSLELAL